MSEQEHACKYCGARTHHHYYYGPVTQMVTGKEGDSVCDDCASKIADFILWRNEQSDMTLLTCPYCGYGHPRSFEPTDPDGDFYCHNCDRAFSFERRVEVTYTTTRRRCDYPGELPHGY